MIGLVTIMPRNYIFYNVEREFETHRGGRGIEKKILFTSPESKSELLNLYRGNLKLG